MQPKARPVVLLFLLGAVVGSVLDAFHVYSNVEGYPTPA